MKSRSFFACHSTFLRIIVPVIITLSLLLTVPFSFAQSIPDYSFLDSLNAANVQWLSSCDFYFYDNDGCFVFVFALKDKNKEHMSAAANVELTIVNDNNIVVYQKEHFVPKEDFYVWTSSLRGERTLGTIFIDPSEIAEGQTEDGTVTAKVTCPNGYFSFNEVTVDTYELPKIDITELCSVQLPVCPVELDYLGYNQRLYAKIMIDSITPVFEENYDGSASLILTFKGEKTYDCDGPSSIETAYIPYKLYDEEGYVAGSGQIMFYQLQEGDKFKNVEERIYSLDPGHYRFVFAEE